ncbi:hypothetical protein [Sagittula stellata]|uniref:Uncharacterized protein n=1 Tax=Sagittula stellata (strain ATCC 700073 / DSM 11524 / E-37) TaxID=388399 RepID=A3K157_SAGS3|nr:hypothetical protein [Sagittula stellata]EBA09522.1 hypothetical protein SSE37_24809 [Sagittula stellata E-37]
MAALPQIAGEDAHDGDLLFALFHGVAQVRFAPVFGWRCRRMVAQVTARPMQGLLCGMP